MTVNLAGQGAAIARQQKRHCRDLCFLVAFHEAGQKDLKRMFKVLQTFRHRRDGVAAIGDGWDGISRL
jgi:hypothetical protein